MNFYYMKCLNMSWVSALLMCQEISMVMASEAYEINKSKTGHPVHNKQTWNKRKLSLKL